jgi:YD repeat-containing protein
MKISKLITAVSAIIFTITIISCKKSGHAEKEYYRNLQFSETPYDIEKGTHKLTADEAKDVNSYKFTYDDSARLVSVEFVRGDQLLGYSSMGGAAKITYTYIGNKQIKHFFNKENKPIEPWGVYTAEYTLDTAGMRIGLEFFDKDSKPIENRNKIHSYVWTKMKDGLIKENRYNLEKKETIMNPFCPFYELRFTYNEKGYTTRMANFQADTLYNCTAENCGDIGVSYFSFVPNEFGDLESFSVHNVAGQLSNLYWGWAKRLNKVNENGYTLETAVYDQDDEYLGGKNVPVTKNIYDSHGAIIEIDNMDSDRNIINHPDNGVAITKYTYDEMGQRKDTLKFDKNLTAIKK